VTLIRLTAVWDRTKRTSKERGFVYGYRSGLEEAIAADLQAKGIVAPYEAIIIPYTKPVKQSKYHPDFYLPNGIIIESKGRWLTDDRQKHLLVKAQHPDLDIRFVFSSAKARLSKVSKTTYAAYCEKHGWKYADKRVPDEWLREPVNEKSLRIIQSL
jgi:hypothetical protein